MEEGRKNKIELSKSAKKKLFYAILAVAILLIAIALYNLFIPPSGPGTSEQFISFKKSSTVDNFTLTVNPSSPKIDISDCRVLVRNAWGTTALDTLLENITGAWMNNVRFTDKDSDGKIGVSDYFELKRGINYFTNGTILILITPDGVGSYGEVTI